MNDAEVLQIVIGALDIALKVAAPILVASLVIGVVVSLLQTITQIQEMTLTFVPKIVGIALIVVFAGGWMAQEMIAWVTALWGSIPSLLG